MHSILNGNKKLSEKEGEKYMKNRTLLVIVDLLRFQLSWAIIEQKSSNIQIVNGKNSQTSIYVLIFDAFCLNNNAINTENIFGTILCIQNICDSMFFVTSSTETSDNIMNNTAKYILAIYDNYYVWLVCSANNVSRIQCKMTNIS